MVFGTYRSRLAAVMADPGTPEEPTTFAESATTFSRYRESAGVSNPWGTGLGAYEPNTAIFDEYQNAYGKVQQSKAKEAADAAAQTYTNVDFRTAAGTTIGAGAAPAFDATGQVGTAINAALELANRRVPYVWGGTSRNGVDCSGLIYYAFRAAGVEIPRMRAVDYAKMAAPITRDEARPGDLVYWDNPNTTTDHIGIYLGNGKVVQAPQTGDVVKVSTVWNNPPAQYRRIVADSAFRQVATPEGGAFWAYGGSGQTWGSVPVTPAPTTIRRTAAATAQLRRKMEF